MKTIPKIGSIILCGMLVVPWATYAAPPIVTERIAVTPAALNGWQQRDEYCGFFGSPGNQGFVFGPTGGEAIEGIGSIVFNTQFDGNKFENISTGAYDGVLLSDITTLRYGTFVSFSNTWWFAVKAPYIVLTLDTDDNGTADDQLEYSPEASNAITTYAWQHWDAVNGLWSEVGGLGNLLGLAPYLVGHPNATIVADAGGRGGVLVGIGCDPLFANLVGHVDAIEIGTAETATLYDFEPLYGPPLIRQQCQNGGWSQFTNPVFRNQGECILAVQKP